MIKLVCPYTVKLHPKHYLEQVQDRSKFLLELFMKLTGNLYDFTLYTDKESYEFLGSPNNVKVKYFDHTSELDFIDDFKVDLLDKLPADTYIVDFDLYLTQHLTIDDSYDVYIERFEEEDNWEVYSKEIMSIPFDEIREFFLSIDALKTIPNIGFFRMNNKQLIQEYSTLYFKYKNKFIKLCKEHNFEYRHYSALFSQHILNHVLSKKDYKVYQCDQSICTHLNGSYKYRLSENDITKRVSLKQLV
jgi:hypothetical protein